MGILEDLLDTAGNIVDSALAVSTPGIFSRALGSEFRTECFQVRAPGLPFGEYLAEGADWWVEQAVNFLEPFATPVRREHERVTSDIQRFLGVPNVGALEDEAKPRFRGFVGPPTQEFLVEVPGWQDIFVLNNDFIFNDRSRRERALDYFDSLASSPTPPSFREAAEILTTLDDIQDEAATLATVLALVERTAGRAIPGVGAVALLADSLDLLGAVARPGTLSSFPGTGSKRRILDKVRGTRKGYVGRIEEARRFRDLEARAQGRAGRVVDPRGTAPRNFRVGVGDIIQGLQATESIFGTGIQLGPIVGFLQDAFWGVVRGATFRARGPIWDPLGFTEAGRSACFRSPGFESIGPRVYYLLANEALSLWRKAGRVFPWVDVLGEPALASLLTGLRLSEQVLGPWLRGGEWIELLGEVLQQDPVVSGGVEAVDTRRLRASGYVERTSGGTVAALNRALTNVMNKDRAAFYESLVSSIAWGFMGSLEPSAVWRELQVAGPGRDAFLAAHVNRVPRIDTED